MADDRYLLLLPEAIAFSRAHFAYALNAAVAAMPTANVIAKEARYSSGDGVLFMMTDFLVTSKSDWFSCGQMGLALLLKPTRMQRNSRV